VAVDGGGGHGTPKSLLIPSSQAECVYNNMPWFDEGNKLDIGSTTHMVHPEISNSQAKCLGIRALSTILLHVASEEHLFIIKCTR
jgi:hypothetical protein